MRNSRCAAVALMGMVLMVGGCKQDKVVSHYQPAKIEESGEKGIMRVTLDQDAAHRIGLETMAVSEESVTRDGAAQLRKVVPYGALMYDTKGEAWMFTSPKPLVYVRQHVVVDDVAGDRVFLAEGPPAGTVVVTVGAAELMGAEHKYGAH